MPNGHSIFQCSLLGSIKGLRPFSRVSLSHTKDVFFSSASQLFVVVVSAVHMWATTATTTKTTVSGEFMLWARACHMNYCRKKLHLFFFLFSVPFFLRSFNKFRNDFFFRLLFPSLLFDFSVRFFLCNIFTHANDNDEDLDSECCHFGGKTHKLNFSQWNTRRQRDSNIDIFGRPSNDSSAYY